MKRKGKKYLTIYTSWTSNDSTYNRINSNFLMQLHKFKWEFGSLKLIINSENCKLIFKIFHTYLCNGHDICVTQDDPTHAQKADAMNAKKLSFSGVSIQEFCTIFEDTKTIQKIQTFLQKIYSDIKENAIRNNNSKPSQYCVNTKRTTQFEYHIIQQVFTKLLTLSPTLY